MSRGRGQPGGALWPWRRVGILGGTFDPIHVGHLIVADQAFDLLGLEKLLFVPACLPPHKEDRSIAAARHRLRMVRLAIQGDRRFAASGLEIRRGGRSYTVDTLRAIRRLCRPTASLFFIMGADQMREIESWRDPERILMMAQIVIMTRPGVSLRGLPPRWRRPVRLIRVTPIGLSSTAIRMRINAGKSIRSFVPEKVREYIERHRLYARP